MVIECDGGQHFTDKGLEVDRVRDEALTQLGLKVLRFDNRQVIGQIDGVVEVIFEFVSQKIESPFSKGGIFMNLMIILDSRCSSLF